VLSTVEISHTEKRLQIALEEVFLGNSVSDLTVTTNQGACLPGIQPGDEWLFYLQRDVKTHSLLLAYGSPTKPVSDAQENIAMLRRLAQMSDSGIITGKVTRQVWDENKWETSVPVPNHKIVAKRESNRTEYVTFTDGDGRYEFEPLPSGSYELTASAAQGLWAGGGRTEVHSRSCSEVGFGLQPDGRISGRVWTADGMPARYAQVAIVPESVGNLVFTSAFA
jgi:Carboxypeptidase regulatory-like domain